MNASRTAQKEPPRQLTQNLLDPALAMHAGGAERRPSGLTDFGRALAKVKASVVRLVPRLRAVASPDPRQRVAARVLTVSHFEPPAAVA